MIFPEYIKSNDIIGVTAPSDGNYKEVDLTRLAYARTRLEQRGYRVYITENVRQSIGGKSGPAHERLEQLMELVENSGVKSIVFAKGGDFLMEVLSLLDYEVLRQNPKWIQGYSDSTGLLFTMTTMCDIATMYSNHFNDFAMEPWHRSVQYNMDLLEGKIQFQKSFDYYEDGFVTKVTGKESYREDKPVHWFGTKNPVEISGRMIGGCLDVLLNLVGTRFDHVKSYIDKYQDDGILWYIESFSLDAESITRGLWQMKEAGWFDHVSGFVFGRPCMFESFIGYTYEEAVMSVLNNLHVPVIFDADLGHKGPQFTVVNGAIGTWRLDGDEGSLSMQYRK